jgi:myo-inositol-1(or 4)-monophosphatase
MFTAIKSQGAFLNGKRIIVSDTKNLQNFVIYFDGGYNSRSKIGKFITHLGDKIRQPNISAGIAMQLTDLACGRVDGVVKIKVDGLYDIVPANLIVEEAGGKITGLNGEKIGLEKKDFLASKGKIHGQLLEEINLATKLNL